MAQKARIRCQDHSFRSPAKHHLQRILFPSLYTTKT